MEHLTAPEPAATIARFTDDWIDVVHLIDIVDRGMQKKTYDGREEMKPEIALVFETPYVFYPDSPKEILKREEVEEDDEAWIPMVHTQKFNNTLSSRGALRKLAELAIGRKMNEEESSSPNARKRFNWFKLIGKCFKIIYSVNERGYGNVEKFKSVYSEEESEYLVPSGRYIRPRWLQENNMEFPPRE